MRVECTILPVSIAFSASWLIAYPDARAAEWGAAGMGTVTGDRPGVMCKDSSRAASAVLSRVTLCAYASTRMSVTGSIIEATTLRL
jgi:hypothetical protein